MKARHLLTVEGDDCRILYDKFSHNEIDADDIVKNILTILRRSHIRKLLLKVFLNLLGKQ